MEVKALAAGENGRQQLVGFGRRQDEDNVRRRLLQRLEEGVGGLLGEHVDFIDDIDLVARLVGGVVHLLAEVSDFVDTAVAGGIDFDNVHSAAFGDCPAHVAFVAGLALAVVEAVDGFSQTAGRAGLAGAAGSAKKVGMRYLLTGEGVKQCLRNMLLSDYLG